MQDLLTHSGVGSEARFVNFVSRSPRNHSTSLLMESAIRLQTLIALRADNAPLPKDHGGPIRSVVPGKYFYKSVKWLERIELLAEDQLGYWEADAGYHNGADPWLEQRYMAPTLDRREAGKLIASGDFSNRDLRSIDASKRALNGLLATKALLRDANFNDSQLANADFGQAQLSNSRFRNAHLVGANFREADLEGADLAGADLRGVDLRGASLFGASFCDWDIATQSPTTPCRFDQNTKVSREQLQVLTPEQLAFVEDQLR